MKVLVVESPAKAKTINKYLGRDYKVIASMGHVRDLPKSKLGVEVDGKFEPATDFLNYVLTVAIEEAQVIEAEYMLGDTETTKWRLRVRNTRQPVKVIAETPPRAFRSTSSARARTKVSRAGFTRTAAMCHRASMPPRANAARARFARST